MGYISKSLRFQTKKTGQLKANRRLTLHCAGQTPSSAEHRALRHWRETQTKHRDPNGSAAACTLSRSLPAFEWNFSSSCTSVLAPFPVSTLKRWHGSEISYNSSPLLLSTSTSWGGRGILPCLRHFPPRYVTSSAFSENPCTIIYLYCIFSSSFSPDSFPWT